MNAFIASAACSNSSSGHLPLWGQVAVGVGMLAAARVVSYFNRNEDSLITGWAVHVLDIVAIVTLASTLVR